MIDKAIVYWRARTSWRTYLPQPVTQKALASWLSQFDKDTQRHLLKLLRHVRYLNDEECRTALHDHNRLLMAHLAKQGIPPKQIIYVQIDDAGSSSPVMLNLLRDTARLHQQGCYLVDSRDLKGIADKTSHLGEGAIIYVDDFIGSGNQLLAAREAIAPYIFGSFAEFSLSVVLCEEGLLALDRVGIEGKAKYLHAKTERPLHADSTLMPTNTKQVLLQLCTRIDKKAPLGFREMATMFVLYRNSPNSIPRVLRGSAHQRPHRGLFPRVQDMPVDP